MLSYIPTLGHDPELHATRVSGYALHPQAVIPGYMVGRWCNPTQIPNCCLVDDIIGVVNKIYHWKVTIFTKTQENVKKWQDDMSRCQHGHATSPISLRFDISKKIWWQQWLPLLNNKMCFISWRKKNPHKFYEFYALIAVLHC